MLLFQSSAVFVFCWRESRPDRWQFFHNYYDALGRDYLDQFLIGELQDAARGTRDESTWEIFAGANAFSCLEEEVSPIPLPLQKKYHVFLVELKKLPDNSISNDNLREYFSLMKDQDCRVCALRRLFDCMQSEENVPLTKFVFGPDGHRLNDAIYDFLDRHRTVNMDARSDFGNDLQSVQFDEMTDNVLDGIRSEVVGALMKDVRPSPLIQHEPSGREIESVKLPFANLFFVVRLPYDEKSRFRFGGSLGAVGIPYTSPFKVMQLIV
ncbi:hypothetical protein [Rhabdochromatium marinum]|uniref:hypothetical protein n=1 Tax=Rhabdochromatium marinum TaxID=48729 RepID=UPI001908E844|nr:hypothetical protein [Rhabdochromatium marinum]